MRNELEIKEATSERTLIFSTVIDEKSTTTARTLEVVDDRDFLLVLVLVLVSGWYSNMIYDLSVGAVAVGAVCMLQSSILYQLSVISYQLSAPYYQLAISSSSSSSSISVRASGASVTDNNVIMIIV